MLKTIIKWFKETNNYLIAGILLTSLLFTIGIFGDYLAPYGLDEITATITDPDTGKITAAPFAPSSNFLLGTDEQGIDMLSKLFHGAKYTLLVVVIISLSRVFIALPLGLIFGWWSKYFKTPLSYINRAWTSIPLFLFVYIILKPIVDFSFEKNTQLFVLWLVLTVAGLPPLLETIRGYVEMIKNYEFMDGVKILGPSRFYVFRKHIIPHLKPYLVVLIAMEMAQILWLLGQLGIFHLFVGGTLAAYDELQGVTHYYSVTNEWAGLLGYGRRFFLLAPWIVLAPAIAFAYGIFSFQLLAEGLRRRLNKNTIRYDSI